MSTQPSSQSSHDISAWRSQYRLTHTFHLLLDNSAPIASEVEAALRRAHARVEKWVIVRRAGCYEHSILVEGISDESARALRKEFAGLAGQIKVHVEHMLHFGGEVTHRC
ncbi:MAG TPA: hypothetical protein VJ752_22970 [Burkholderiaceae bacterium]|nr:hypothetical protein [Burkholderiaceae bacterium]